MDFIKESEDDIEFLRSMELGEDPQQVWDNEIEYDGLLYNLKFNVTDEGFRISESFELDGDTFEEYKGIRSDLFWGSCWIDVDIHAKTFEITFSVNNEDLDMSETVSAWTDQFEEDESVDLKSMMEAALARLESFMNDGPLQNEFHMTELLLAIADLLPEPREEEDDEDEEEEDF